jgi:aspartate/methionine/tyrosine aminotransferase
MAGLTALPGIEATSPDGGMYVMLRIDGEQDSLALAKRLIAEAALGLAPGAAFGPEGEGWLRWCFAVSEPALDEGVERLEGWLRRR